MVKSYQQQSQQQQQLEQGEQHNFLLPPTSSDSKYMSSKKDANEDDDLAAAARRLSFDSLAYSEITGAGLRTANSSCATITTLGGGRVNSKTISAESLRLNGYLQSESSSLLQPFPSLQLSTSDQQQQQQQLYKQVSAAASRKDYKSNHYRPTSSYWNKNNKNEHSLVETTTTREWFHHPKVRTCYFLSVIVALTTVLVLTSGILDSEWIQNLTTIGLRGMRAQGIADASFIKTIMSPPSAATSIYHNNYKNINNNDNNKDGGKPEEPANGCESTIMLIRHCEKGDLRSHCNYHGFERAAFLATQFGDDHHTRWPAPSQIYALKAGGRGHRGKTSNFREIETVQFLAKKLHLDVDESYDTSDRQHLVRKLLESILSGDQCGKLTLVSWKHSDLARLSHLLGCGPFEGCPMDYKGREFDQVWQLKYVYRSFHHGPKAEMTYKHWDIFGSVQYENFDPLAYSKVAGDYPRGGTSHAGRWADPDQELFD